MVSIIELSRFEGENVPHMAHHTPLSHREVVWSQGSMGIISVPWPPLGLPLSEGMQLHTLGNPIFSIMMDLG